MSNQSIYNALRTAGMGHAGACALMGNMKAESAMQSNNAQNGMTSLTDEEYTTAADTGRLDFVNDKVGYGLCQWTYWSRKAQLANFCQTKGVSVGDEAAQVQFCIKEIKKDFPSLWTRLCNGYALYELTAAVCKEYERPAVNNIDTRYRFALQFDNEFKDNQSDEIESPVNKSTADPDIAHLQAVMVHCGYNTPIDGIKSAQFKETFREFANDVIK